MEILILAEAVILSFHLTRETCQLVAVVPARHLGAESERELISRPGSLLPYRDSGPGFRVDGYKEHAIS